VRAGPRAGRNVVTPLLEPWASFTERQLDDAFHVVRCELAELGLLDEGRYLDRIDCVRTPLPSLGDTAGYVYDEGVSWLERALWFRGGVIYVPFNAPVAPRVPGGTLRDILRHEFAHAWAWLDRPFVRRPWFRETFGAPYHGDWSIQPDFDPDAFASNYACTLPKEDFAETFMLLLRHRRSLDRFAARRGLYRKLRRLERAVAIAARERAPRVRGPREG
jgi:hypothetical protein